MPTLTLYPSTVVAGSGFTTTELAKVLGNTAEYATFYGWGNVGVGESGRFYFPMTDIPANAIISSVTANVIVWSNSSYRQAYSVDCYGSVNKLVNNGATMATTATAYSFPGFAGASTAAWRDNSIEWTFNTNALASGNVYVYWQKFWIDVVYTQPASGNSLFLGNNY